MTDASTRLSGDGRRVAFGLFAIAYGTNVSTPFLVTYRERLDLSVWQSQTIFTVYVVGILATLLVAGPLSDRIGRRAVVLPAGALSMVASLIFIPGRNSFALLLLGRLLLGVVSGAALGVAAAWLQEVAGKGAEQRAAVLTTLLTFAGFGGAPPVSALFEALDLAPLVTPFLVHLVLMAVGLVVVWPVPDPRLTVPGGRLRVDLGVPADARSSFVSVVVPAAIWVFGFPSVGFALLPVLVGEFVSSGVVLIAAACGSFTAFAGLLARPVLARIPVRRALPLALATGAAGYGLGMWGFLASTWAPVLPATVLLGGASGVLTAGCLTLLGEMADDDRRGALASTFYLLAYPGMAMPTILTSIALVSSIEVALAGAMAAAVVASVLLARNVRGLS